MRKGSKDRSVPELSKVFWNKGQSNHQAISLGRTRLNIKTNSQTLTYTISEITENSNAKFYSNINKLYAGMYLHILEILNYFEIAYQCFYAICHKVYKLFYIFISVLASMQVFSSYLLCCLYAVHQGLSSYGKLVFEKEKGTTGQAM